MARIEYSMEKALNGANNLTNSSVNIDKKKNKKWGKYQAEWRILHLSPNKAIFCRNLEMSLMGVSSVTNTGRPAMALGFVFRVL